MSARVTRSIEHRINFGDYEGLTVRASVEADCDEGLESLNLKRLRRLLSEAVEEELDQARRLAPNQSYIQEWEGK